MKTIWVKGKSSDSQVLIGETLPNVAKRINLAKTIIITDENVYRLYQNIFPPSEVIVIGTGEKLKTFSTIEFILQKLLELNTDREHFILGIGGGLVCDITGFVASVYLRGLKFGFVATTLLAQVDASIGGKNGINFKGFKNIVGVINQPEFVICDPSLLSTLPLREIRSGIAEIIKYGAIADHSILDFLEDNRSRIQKLDPEIIETLVYSSVSIKAKIVSSDEKEFGERKKLNFGHTYGHAIEVAQEIPHGEAISIGMVLAAQLSFARGLITSEEMIRLMKLLKLFNLPLNFNCSKLDIVNIFDHDKKRTNDKISFILLNSLGSCRISNIEITELTSFIMNRTPVNLDSI